MECQLGETHVGMFWNHVQVRSVFLQFSCTK